MKRLLESLASSTGKGLARVGLSGALIGRKVSGPRVLLYHSVGLEGSPFIEGLDAPVPVPIFERHLDFLLEHYTPITVQDLDRGTLPRRAVLVTFDDGYRCLLTHALGPLRERGIQPIVFLIGNTVGNRGLAWTNEVAWNLNTHRETFLEVMRSYHPSLSTSATSDVVHFLLSRLSTTELHALLKLLRGRVGYDPQTLAQKAELYLTWRDIDVLREHGWTFGNHTANHYSLPTLDSDLQEREIAEGRAVLEAHLGEVRHLAYPFGHVDASSRAAALRSGHEILMEVGGANPSPPDLSRLARVPTRAQASPEGLFAAMEVVEPLKAWLRPGVRRHELYPVTAGAPQAPPGRP